ncbi:MAG: hypothetical protein HW403_467 [Dehalococcoidia bacterium]|nr:hypothetical protein [Dehalococcoidia bacterium]
MNSFNKALSISFLSLLLLKGAAALILVWLFPGELIATFRFLAAFASNNPVLFRMTVTAVAGLIFMLSLFILLAEFSDENEGLIEVATESGVTLMSLEAVRQYVGEAAMSVEEVEEADSTIQAKGTRVDIILRVRLSSDGNPSQAADHVQEVVREQVNKLGLSLGELKVTILPTYPHQSQPRTTANYREKIIVPGSTVDKR